MRLSSYAPLDDAFVNAKHLHNSHRYLHVKFHCCIVTFAMRKRLVCTKHVTFSEFSSKLYAFVFLCTLRLRVSLCYASSQ